MSETRAQLNRKVRQEALRDQLANQGHLQHVVEILDRIRDPKEEIEDGMLARYKVVLDNKQKLIDKYIPGIKAIELTGDGGEDININTLHDIPDELLERMIANDTASSKGTTETQES